MCNRDFEKFIKKAQDREDLGHEMKKGGTTSLLSRHT